MLRAGAACRAPSAIRAGTGTMQDILQLLEGQDDDEIAALAGQVESVDEPDQAWPEGDLI